jgi:cytochrome c peroxidase
MINGRMASADGAIKTFPLRGIKDSPPYLHDGRLLTLDDAVEFFNLVLELKLTEQEKKDTLAFLRQLRGITDLDSVSSQRAAARCAIARRPMRQTLHKSAFSVAYQLARVKIDAWPEMAEKFPRKIRR